MNKNMKLKPCPFCGGKAEKKNRNYCADIQFDDDHDEFWCQCKICGSRGKLIHIKNARYRETCKIELEKAEKESMLAWNTRQ